MFKTILGRLSDWVSFKIVSCSGLPIFHCGLYFRQVQCLDSLGNRRDSGADVVSGYLLSRTDDSNLTNASVISTGNGAYAIRYCVQTCGVHDLHVLIGDDEVRGSPFRVEVVAGDALASSCELTKPLVTGDDQTTWVELSLFTCDSFGNYRLKGLKRAFLNCFICKTFTVCIAAASS